MSAQVYEQVRARSQREELILAHLSLVRHIIGRLAAKLPHGIDLENLEAAGTLGLVEAANRYEPERGIPFKTFAYTRIRGAILDELRRNSPFPQELLERITKVRKAVQALTRSASMEALAQHANLSVDEVAECLSAMRLTRMLSWDDVGEPATANLIGAGPGPESRLEEAERKRFLVEAITALPDTERLAVTLYYLEDLRLKEIGLVMNLSESRVSRLLKAAEQRIEEHLRAREEQGELAA